MILLSEFAVKNGLGLDIWLPQGIQNAKKTENAVLEIFGQNNVSIKNNKTRKEPLRIVTKEANATTK